MWAREKERDCISEQKDGGKEGGWVRIKEILTLNKFAN